MSWGTQNENNKTTMPVQSGAEAQAQALAQAQPKTSCESMKRVHRMQIRRARTRTRSRSGAETSELKIATTAAQLAAINMKPSSDSRLAATTITRNGQHSIEQTTCLISRYQHNSPNRRHRLQMISAQQELLARPLSVNARAINTISTTNHLFLLLLSSSLLFLLLSLSTLPIPASSMILNNNNNNQQAGDHQLAGQMFTCGKLYYRTFHMDQQRNVLYLGAM